ncbi:enolase C-terminal domain-like protein, partial [Chloroflexota bacterium]
HAGGISETLRIANMAEAYDVALAPHCPLGPIALAACLQIDAVAHNAFIQEQSLGLHYNVSNDLLDYLEDSTVFAFEDGYIKILEGPGLGIQVNESYVEAKSKEGYDWRNPLWRLVDNSVTEW